MKSNAAQLAGRPIINFAYESDAKSILSECYSCLSEKAQETELQSTTQVQQ